jgi:hypothetical protein
VWTEAELDSKSEWSTRLGLKPPGRPKCKRKTDALLGTMSDKAAASVGQTIDLRYDPSARVPPTVDSWSGLWLKDLMGIFAGVVFLSGAALCYVAFGDRIFGTWVIHSRRNNGGYLGSFPPRLPRPDGSPQPQAWKRLGELRAEAFVEFERWSEASRSGHRSEVVSGIAPHFSRFAGYSAGFDSC